MSLKQTELLRLARSGAAERVREIQQELSSLYSAFPELRKGQLSKAKPGRRGWTAAQRREARERMKKYWAARKRGQPSKS